MARYCKVCGAKSGRCNHIMVDFGEREESEDKNEDDSGTSDNSK